MNNFEIILYSDVNGSCQILDFIKEQNKDMKARIIKDLELLEEYGNLIQGKKTKCLEDGIFELRVKVSSDITRILFFFYKGKKIILTNAFTKKHLKHQKNKLKQQKKIERNI